MHECCLSNNGSTSASTSASHLLQLSPAPRPAGTAATQALVQKLWCQNIACMHETQRHCPTSAGVWASHLLKVSHASGSAEAAVDIDGAGDCARFTSAPLCVHGRADNSDQNEHSRAVKCRSVLPVESEDPHFGFTLGLGTGMINHSRSDTLLGKPTLSLCRRSGMGKTK